jgi:glycosyltransferase involved in cell wall biosynthesis
MPHSYFKPKICLALLFVFLSNVLIISPICAQPLTLPAAGSRIVLSEIYSPIQLKGIKVNPHNPLKFEFVLDKGDEKPDVNLRNESIRLIKYFLAALTVPDKDLWVNLSPYEKDRITADSFGITEMGRDLLGQDYILKQLTASLIYPEEESGKSFWKRIYAESAKRFGSTNVPVNTFNKVWIVPAKAVVYEDPESKTAYIIESSLKVMLEEDYLASQKNGRKSSDFSSEIIRQVILPEIEREVNSGKNFAKLRQIYNSLILAVWFKKKIKDAILSRTYVNQNKTAGVTIDDPKENEKIYDHYLLSLKKGAYNYIKEEKDPLTGRLIQRKYFSGGVNYTDLAQTSLVVINQLDAAQISENNLVNASVDLRVAGPLLKTVLSKPPLISVIIPAYNMGKSIKKAIESVLNQTVENFEIIVVDDASTDDTEAIVKALMPNEPRIRYIRNPKNGGKSIATNLGLEVFKGEYVAILDADDTLPPKSLESRVVYLKNHDDIDFVYTSSEFQNNGRKRNTRKAVQFSSSQELANRTLAGPTVPVTMATLMFRKDIFATKDESRRIRLNPKARRAEDINLLFDLAKNGYTSGALDEVTYNYEQTTHKITTRIQNRLLCYATQMAIASKYITGWKRLYFYSRISGVTAAKLAWELLSREKNVLNSEKEDTMGIDPAQTVGGIGLNSLDLQTRNEGEAINFDIDQKLFEHLQNAQGFWPDITRFTPLTDLKSFLGIAEVYR